MIYFRFFSCSDPKPALPSSYLSLLGILGVFFRKQVVRQQLLVPFSCRWNSAVGMWNMRLHAYIIAFWIWNNTSLASHLFQFLYDITVVWCSYMRFFLYAKIELHPHLHLHFTCLLCAVLHMWPQVNCIKHSGLQLHGNRHVLSTIVTTTNVIKNFSIITALNSVPCKAAHTVMVQHNWTDNTRKYVKLMLTFSYLLLRKVSFCTLFGFHRSVSAHTYRKRMFTEQFPVLQSFSLIIDVYIIFNWKMDAQICCFKQTLHLFLIQIARRVMFAKMSPKFVRNRLKYSVESLLLLLLSLAPTELVHVFEFQPPYLSKCAKMRIHDR